jgi:membrane fusion protein (multidrug efflux system)
MRRTSALLGLALLACGGAVDVAPLHRQPVEVASVEARDLDETLEATGQLLAKERAGVAAQVAGMITEVVIDEGAPVAEGGVVLEIDPERRQLEVDAARAGLAQARAQVAEVRREAARVERLFEKDIAARVTLDQTRTEVTLAQARVEAAAAQLGTAERALADASVRAPFAGLIARRHVSAGEFVQPGKELFELVALDPIEVEFHVAERDSSRVAEAQQVGVRVAPFPEETFRGEVTVVSPTIDPRTRTLRVKALIQNPEARLRPGLFARVDLGVAHRTNVLLVPEEAVLQRSDGSVVFRLDAEERAERLVVETGSFVDGKVEVRGPVRAGDILITRGHSQLEPGVLVSVTAPGPGPEGEIAVGAAPAGARDGGGF